MKKAAFFLLFFIPHLVDAHGFGWKFRNAAEGVWYPAGDEIDVFEDLLQNGLIPDPFLAGNETLVQWVGESDWVYETQFHHSPRMGHYRLVLDNVDTYADVYLNGTLLFSTDNAFISYEVEVAHLLRWENTLSIRFYSPVKRDALRAKKSRLIYPADNDPHPLKTIAWTRKPAYHAGWDFAPRLIHFRVGDVELRGYNQFYFSDLSIRPEMSGEVEVALRIFSTQPQECVIQLRDASKAFEWRDEKCFLTEGWQEKKFRIRVPQPQLWWPNGMGESRLYQMIVSARDGNAETEVSSAFAFRTVRLSRNRDEAGESFTFYVNDKPLFAKGANYIQTEKELPEEVFNNLKSAGFNMLRVWGGGYYGSDAFYEACDRLGFLVWQDFMFSGTMYPGDADFLENVRKEAAFQVRRIAGHPSIALWCGNNEVEVAWNNWGWKDRYSRKEQKKLEEDYHRLFREMLPSLLVHTGQAYLSSSPVSNWGKKDEMYLGDNHLWGVYHGDKPFDWYNISVPRFASEFGFQSFPEEYLLRQYVADTLPVLEAPAFTSRQKSYKKNDLLQRYLLMYLKPAADLSDFIYKTQLLQADAMRTAIESQLRNKPFCSGSLYWQLNDVWPGISWSTLDYLNTPKAAHEVVRELFQPLVISAWTHGDSLSIYLVTDYFPEGVYRDSLEYRLTLSSLTGKTIRENSRRVIPAENKSVLLESFAVKEFLSGHAADRVVLRAGLFHGDSMLVKRYIFADTLKNIQFPPPGLQYEVIPAGSHCYIRISSDYFAKAVYLQHAEFPGRIFSENWFDLWPGEQKLIKVLLPAFPKDQLIIRSLE